MMAARPGPGPTLGDLVAHLEQGDRDAAAALAAGERPATLQGSADRPAALDPAPVVRARAEMERAVAAYVDACAAHAATLAAAWIALAAGPSPDGARVDAGGPGGVAVGGRVYARTRVRRWLRLAAEVALRQRYPRPPVEPDKA